MFHAIFLGVVQGITEFLPVSSSGHLLILPQFFSWEQQGLDFDVAVHVATLGAIMIALRKDVAVLFRAPLLFALVSFATIPVVVFGMLIPSSVIEGLRSPFFVAISLIIWGIALIVADGISRHHQSLPALFRVGWRRALFVGCAQILALIPGTSRSGITMTAGMVSGLTREDAARFAFLLALPAIAGAGVLTAKDAIEFGFSTDLSVIIAGMLAAFFSGLLSIRLLLLVARKSGFWGFGLYRILLGLVIFFIL